MLIFFVLSVSGSKQVAAGKKSGSATPVYLAGIPLWDIYMQLTRISKENWGESKRT